MNFGGNPEFAAMRNLDNQSRSEEIRASVERLVPHHDRVDRALKDIEIKPEDFSDLYSEERIAQDGVYVTDREARFAQTDQEALPGTHGLTRGDVRKLSDIAEFSVIKGLNQGQWIPYCGAIKTSRYDDIANGVDSVLEFAPPGQFANFGLSIDVSFSQNLASKFERIKKEIDRFDPEDDQNQLGYIRYFKSDKSGHKGRLTGLPRVVMALDTKVVEDLYRIKDVRGHVARHEVVRELEEQLAVFTQYAGDTGSGAYDKLQRAQNFVEVISQHLGSEEALKRAEYTKNNQASESIKRGLQIFQ